MLLILQLLYFRAYDILGFSAEGITLQQLEAICPDKFGGKFDDDKLCDRLKIEALYQISVHGQQGDIERVELDQSLLIPTDIDYTE